MVKKGFTSQNYLRSITKYLPRGFYNNIIALTFDIPYYYVLNIINCLFLLINLY